MEVINYNRGMLLHVGTTHLILFVVYVKYMT